MIRAGFRLDGPLEALFNKTLDQCFADAGYNDNSKAGDPGTEPFGMNEFIETFERTLREETGYSGRVGSDVRAAGIVRLGTLMNLSRAVFDTVKTVPPEALISGRTVLQLNRMTSTETKQLFCTMLLISLGAKLRLTTRSSDALRLVIVLDEAHNLLNAVTTASGERYSFADDFLAMLLELRSLGVGIIVSDQSADHLPPMISAICHTKIFMGGSSASGVDSYRRTFGLDDAGAERLCLLGPGDGLLNVVGDARSYFFHTPNLIDLFGLQAPLKPVNAWLSAHPETLTCPYRECARCPAAGRCSSQARTVAVSNAIRLRRYNEGIRKAKDAASAQAFADAVKPVLRRIFTEAGALAGQNDAVYYCTLVNYLRTYNRENARKLPVDRVLASAQWFREQRRASAR